MKKTLLLGLCAWLLAIGKVSADADVLTVGNVTIPKGGQATMEIVCSLSKTYVGGQWDVELPDDGKVTPIMSGGKPVATFGFTGTDHSISSSQLKDAQENLLQKYRFVFTSMSKAELPTSGVLMRIVLNASDNAEIGAEYNVKLSNIELGTANSEKSNISDVTFKITIGNPLETVTLYENSTTTPAASSGPVNVTVNRTINANEWSTICLPFDMSEEQVKEAFGEDVQLADFTSWSFEGTVDNVEKITIGFTDVTAIVKNHPYIIKVSEGITSFAMKNVEIDPVDEPFNDVDYEVGTGRNKKTYNGHMYGTYAKGATYENDIFLSDNQFWYSNGNTIIKAFRATFSFESIILNEVNANRIIISFDDNVTTAIKGNVSKTTDDGKYYNLGGQQVNEPKKGIYVKDGKKVIIK